MEVKEACTREWMKQRPALTVLPPKAEHFKGHSDFHQNSTLCVPYISARREAAQRCPGSRGSRCTSWNPRHPDCSHSFTRLGGSHVIFKRCNVEISSHLKGSLPLMNDFNPSENTSLPVSASPGQPLTGRLCKVWRYTWCGPCNCRPKYFYVWTHTL